MPISLNKVLLCKVLAVAMYPLNFVSGLKNKFREKVCRYCTVLTISKVDVIFSIRFVKC